MSSCLPYYLYNYSIIELYGLSLKKAFNGSVINLIVNIISDNFSRFAIN